MKTWKLFNDESNLNLILTNKFQQEKKQNLKDVEDYGIGVGLSHSRELARFIKGDVKLIKS